MVTLNSYNKMEEEPATPVRQSKRISARAAAAAAEAAGEDPVAAAAAVNAEPGLSTDYTFSVLSGIKSIIPNLQRRRTLGQAEIFGAILPHSTFHTE